MQRPEADACSAESMRVVAIAASIWMVAQSVVTMMLIAFVDPSESEQADVAFVLCVLAQSAANAIFYTFILLKYVARPFIPA